MTFANEDLVNDFVLRFNDRTLPREEWTHPAHLAVGLWHVIHHGDDALSLLRERINAYNEATASDAYHETVTAFFVEALRAYARAGSETDKLKLFNGLRDSYLTDASLPLGFYSRQLIESERARKEQLQPDLQPWDALRALFPPPTQPAPPCFIRPGGRHDGQAFTQLVSALADFEKLPAPDADAQARLIEDAFGDKPRLEVWMAIVPGQRAPVGYAALLETYSSFLAKPTLYIEDIFVLPDMRRRGIGRALLLNAVKLARARGCGRVEWTALDWNVGAQQLYERELGAQRMSEWHLYRMTDEAMRKLLRQDP